MGRTIPTVRQNMEALAARLQKMAQIMNSDDSGYLNNILVMGRRHAHEVSYAGMDVEYGFLLSIILELEKEIRKLREELGT